MVFLPYLLTYDAMVNSGIEFPQQRTSLSGYQPLYGAPENRFSLGERSLKGTVIYVD